MKILKCAQSVQCHLPSTTSGAKVEDSIFLIELLCRSSSIRFGNFLNEAPLSSVIEAVLVNAIRVKLSSTLMPSGMERNRFSSNWSERMSCLRQAKLSPSTSCRLHCRNVRADTDFSLNKGPVSLVIFELTINSELIGSFTLVNANAMVARFELSQNKLNPLKPPARQRHGKR